MKTRRIAAETLLQIALETLENEVRPTVPKERRYALAMALNAIKIARREILTDDQTALWDLLDTVYPDGDGTVEQLAADIRSGAVNERAPPDLVQQLKEIVVSELRVRNPDFLKSRGV